MSETTKLRLPFLAASQAQKHVTHNEALLMLDALLHLEVLDQHLSAPPSTPAEGDRYIVATGASGEWAGESGNIAAWQDGVWRFYEPQIGWRVFVRDEGALYVRTAEGWSALISRAWVNLTDAAMININAASGDKFRVTSSGTRTLSKPGNLVDGMRFIVRITNSAAIALTLDAAFAPLSGAAPALRTTSGQMNTFDCIYDAVADKVFYVWH